MNTAHPKYSIEKFIKKLCRLKCSYDIDYTVQKELDILEQGNIEKVDQITWNEYHRDIQDISFYLHRAKFREMKKIYQPLIDKLEGMKD